MIFGQAAFLKLFGVYSFKKPGYISNRPQRKESNCTLSFSVAGTQMTASDETLVLIVSVQFHDCSS